MTGLDTTNPRSVARWAAKRAYDDASDKILWLKVNVSGPGYMLTDVNESPRAGIWTRVVKVELEEAGRITQGGPKAWPALVRLTEKIGSVLDKEGVGGA